jgi:predicted HicB family RNase H-like nuclease
MYNRKPGRRSGMEAKLTLKLDKDIIDEAKKYALKKNISLSRMVERYFKALVTK